MPTRRSFVGGLVGGALAVACRSSKADQVRVGVLGCGRRGRRHVERFVAAGARVMWVCDASVSAAEAAAKLCAERGGGQPRVTSDLQAVLADPGVDAVSVALPNHWHALSALWAMEANKALYLEKPGAHTVHESRVLEAAAARRPTLCQVGYESRSSGGIAAALHHVRSGRLGGLRKITCHIVAAARGPATAPTSDVDRERWAGPAPLPSWPIGDRSWSVRWPYGGGALTDSGVHFVDLALWTLGPTRGPHRVTAIGLREDDGPGQTPTSLVAKHELDGVELIQIVRPSDQISEDDAPASGLVFEGEAGSVIIAGGRAELSEPDGRKVGEFRGPDRDHFADLLAAVRLGKPELLRCPLADGLRAARLAALANASYQLATETELTHLEEEAARAMATRLSARGVERVRKGPTLTSSHGELLEGPDAAAPLLTRTYREGYALPAAG